MTTVNSAKPELLIAGTRGIPHQHGGFESFAQHLALHFSAIGENVTVACQSDARRGFKSEVWRGVKLLKIPAILPGPIGTIIFDLFTALYAIVNRPIVLTLGYNTAFVFFFYKIFGIVNIVNMDGIEWRRSKWSILVRIWFYINEHLAMWLGDILVADHPVIAERLCRKVDPARVIMIPYGAHRIVEPELQFLEAEGLDPSGYALVVARPEPENSILEIVQGFVAAKLPGKLVLLGEYDTSRNRYHRAVVASANQQVHFLGAIYDQTKVETLRSQAWLYIHGHQVGGTNPSLVEALAAQCPILAHDNPYNAWVAGADMAFFRDAASCAGQLKALCGDSARLGRMRHAAKERFEALFQLEPMYERYLEVLTKPATCIASATYAQRRLMLWPGQENDQMRGRIEPPVR